MLSGWKQHHYKNSSSYLKSLSPYSLGRGYQGNMDTFLSSDPFCLPLATSTTTPANKFQNTRAQNSCDQTITGPHHLPLPHTLAGCVLLTHSSSQQAGNAVSSSCITMASFLSSIVMCVALGIPSPSKNPSLVNSS